MVSRSSEKKDSSLDIDVRVAHDENDNDPLLRSVRNHLAPAMRPCTPTLTL